MDDEVAPLWPPTGVAVATPNDLLWHQTGSTLSAHSYRTTPIAAGADEALAQRGCAAVGVDASEAYLAGARNRRSHPAITYEHGDARSLAYATASFDACVSLLAIDVIPEPEKAAAEMRRVTRPGGVVACGTSDFGGGNYSFLMLLDIGAVFDDGFRALREYLLPRRLVRLNGQAQLWRQTGFTDVVEVPIVVNFDYESFDDYWTSQATGPTRTAQRLQAMPVDRRDEIPT